jgi:hypothetical protein
VKRIALLQSRVAHCDSGGSPCLTAPRRPRQHSVASAHRDHPSMALDAFPDDAMEALAACVGAVVARQRTDPEDEIFTCTRHYGNLGDVTLTLPPGPPRGWEVDAVRVAAASRPRYDVVVAMWTREEGRSDLSLEVDLCSDGHRWVAVPRLLHVL